MRCAAGIWEVRTPPVSDWDDGRAVQSQGFMARRGGMRQVRSRPKCTHMDKQKQAASCARPTALHGFTPPLANSVVGPSVEHLPLALIPCKWPAHSPQYYGTVCHSGRGLAEFNGEAHAHMHASVRIHARLHTQRAPQLTITAITHWLQRGSGHIDGLTGATSGKGRTASATQRPRCKRNQRRSKWPQSNHSRHTAPMGLHKHHLQL